MSCFSLSPDEILGKIEEKHWSLMNEGIDYGNRNSDLKWDFTNADISFDPHHAYVQYSWGQICWGVGTGVHGVYGSFVQGWRDRFYDLGYPVTTTRPCKNGEGYFTHFENGSLVTSGSGNWGPYKDPRRSLPESDQQWLLAYNSKHPEDAERDIDTRPPPYMLVMLPSSRHEKMVLREPNETRRATDFSKYYVALLLGYGRGAQEPVVFWSRGDLGVYVQVITQRAYQIANVVLPYWELEIPLAFCDGHVPSRCRLTIDYKEAPPYDGVIVQD